MFVTSKETCMRFEFGVLLHQIKKLWQDKVLHSLSRMTNG